MSHAQKTTRTGTKPRKQQQKQIIRNVSLNLMQKKEDINIKQEHRIC